MNTPHEVAQATLDAHVIQDGWVRTGAQVRELIAEAVAADRVKIAEALNIDNSIISAYTSNVIDPSPEDGPDIEYLWLQYIDNGDIGWDYTKREAKQARAYIAARKVERELRAVLTKLGAL